MSNPKSTPKKDAAARRRSRKGIVRLIMTLFLVAFVGVGAFFLYQLGSFGMGLYRGWTSGGGLVDSDQYRVYDPTPADQTDKVGYYLVGLMGVSPDADPLETLSVMCFDREKKTLRILQLPRATYIGEEETWAVRTAAEIWAHPQDWAFCAACGDKHVFAPEIAEGKHTVCGTPVTMRAGSSGGNLAQLFNRQFSLPVDGYFFIPQAALVKLVDLLGGVDVDLDATLKVGETTYAKGVRTLDGAAALAYVTDYGDGIDKDIAHLTRVQMLTVSVLQRLLRAEDAAIQSEVIGPLQSGSTPLRVSREQPPKTITAFLAELRQVSPASMTSYVLPGESAKKGGTTYFSPHRAELLALLSEQFNPYGRALSEADIRVAELSATKAGDLHACTLDTLAVPQSGESVRVEAAAGTGTGTSGGSDAATTTGAVE